MRKRLKGIFVFLIMLFSYTNILVAANGVDSKSEVTKEMGMIISYRFEQGELTKAEFDNYIGLIETVDFEQITEEYLLQVYQEALENIKFRKQNEIRQENAPPIEHKPMNEKLFMTQVEDYLFFSLDDEIKDATFYLSDANGNKVSEDVTISALPNLIKLDQIKQMFRWVANAQSSRAYLTSGGYDVRVPIIRRTDNNQMLYCMQSSGSYPEMSEYDNLGDPYMDNNVLGILYYGADGDNRGQIAEAYNLNWDYAQYGTQVALWRVLHKLGYPVNSYQFSHLAGDNHLITYIEELETQSFANVVTDFHITGRADNQEKTDKQMTEPLGINEPMAYCVAVSDSRAWVSNVEDIAKQTCFAPNEQFRVSVPGNFIDDLTITVKTEQEHFNPIFYGAKDGRTQTLGVFDRSDPIVLEQTITTYFEGSVGGFKLHKEDNLGNYLSNIEFVLSSTKDKVTAVTDIDGNRVTVVTDQLGNAAYEAKILLGEYWLFETRYPDHLHPLKKPIAITIHPGQITDLGLITNTITKYNQYELFKFEIRDDNVQGLVRTFEIYREDTNALVDVITTNKNGIARTIWLPDNELQNNQEIAIKYYALEVLTLQEDYGYQKPAKIELVGIRDENNVTHVNVENKRKSIHLKILKQDENGVNLSNIEFQAFDDNHNLILTVSSNDQGEVLFENIDILTVYQGKGYVIETKTAAHLELDETKIPIPAIDLQLIEHNQIINLNGGQPWINRFKTTLVVTGENNDAKLMSGFMLVPSLLFILHKYVWQILSNINPKHKGLFH